ncbi:MAG TPA: galactose oxidase-like domain-containing protein [Pyrinomonadaceae bacterium]|nr:galactose oxidase-like domain-containing protein [Pyrinomonadaceae bacterium]
MSRLPHSNPAFLRSSVALVAVLLIVLGCFCFQTTAQEDPTFGTWAMSNQAPGNLLATHATLLRNNKILVVGGSSYNCCFSWGKEEARLYDIATGTWGAKLTSPAPYGSTKDAFCSGHAHDNNGGVIFQGGLLGYWELNGHGIPESARYDPATGSFAQITGGAAHWYPTLVAGTNDMFIFPGLDTGGGLSIQKLGYGATSWISTVAMPPTKQTYPRVTLLPNGKFFIASPAEDDLKNRIFDPASNTVTHAGAGDDVVPETDPTQIHFQESWKGTAVLLPLVPSLSDYPQMRVALINGMKSYVKDLGQSNPKWKDLGVRPAEIGATERNFANSTILPTGQIFVSGGVGPSEHDMDAVRKPEIYDPETNNWLLTSPATVPRNYHGAALLLPDGRVWTASASQQHSGSQCNVEHGCEGPEMTEERVEIFSPWYVGRSDRPVVSSCPGAVEANGSQFEISIGGSQGMNIGRVVMIRAGSVTHSFDTDQRMIQLDIVSRTASSVTVKAPYRPEAAPPGDYMLFVLRSISTTGFKRWVPSVGCWMRVATTDRRVTGAPIWRYTGPACSGNNCPGWERLDNNPKTMAIVATGTHHDQILYQLHNDGWIWRFTGGPCVGTSCPGWQRLDNNRKTVGIAAAGSQLYQLHNDGWIWRYTGTPCSGDNCPGWQRLDKNSKTVAIVAAGNQLYQLHNDGWIWRYTGTPCAGENCSGWQRLDNNAKTVSITAGGDQLYQLHNDGWIWRYTGTPCNGENCSGWQRLDRNAKTVAIVAASDQLYQLHNDGWIWRYTGTPCSGDNCSGWQRLDNNSRTVAIAAMGNDLFQLHNDGKIWRYTGTPCSANNCPGWQQLDNNPRTGIMVASDPPRMGGGDTVFQLHTDPIYQLHNDGKIWRYTGTECEGDSCPGWERLDNNTRTAQIVAAGAQVFQRHTDGKIWRYTGTPCSGTSCPGWQQLDNNPRTKTIAAAGMQLFQLHDNGKIWRYTGTPCTGTNCPGWQELDRNPRTIAIAAAPVGLIQLHNDGKIWRYTGKPCTATACPGWQLLDNNPNAKSIVATANQVFQLHANGAIWRYTGTPCSGNSCPGWQQLDNNSRTTAIAAAGTQLYQLHNDGKIWRYTGTPCTGATNCPGWERLDNNSRTRDIIATGDHLYQRHVDGRIWRYIGPPCSGENCPGWRQLDNNPRTTRITAGGFN